MDFRPFSPSFVLLGKAFKGIHKSWAYTFGRSVFSMYKMTEEPRSDANPEASGQRNYLDEAYLSAHCLREEGHLEDINEVARWLAHVHGGFFTPYFEPTGIADADFCKVVNNLIKSMAMIIEGLRFNYFVDGQPRSFTKAQRIEIHKQVNEVMAAAVTIHDFIRLHKAEEKK